MAIVETHANDEPVARFSAARLPWHPAIEDRFAEIGVTKTTWKVLTEAIWPAARSVDSVLMALAYCKSRRFDPFKRMVHIVPVWDSSAENGKGGFVETVWPSIAELRTTAFRTGQYAGCDETQFGPEVTRKFTGRVYNKKDKSWNELSIEATFPEWAQITVYRMLGGHRMAFAGPKTYWLESYGRRGGTDLPNDMWARRGRGQLEKCAEAAALRKAFPEELGNEYTSEEMEGQVLVASAEGQKHLIAQTIEFPAAQSDKVRRGPPSPPSALQVAARKGPPPAPKAAPEKAEASAPEASADELLPDPISYLSHLSEQMTEALTQEEFEEVWSAHKDVAPRLSEEHQKQAREIWRHHQQRLMG